MRSVAALRRPLRASVEHVPADDSSTPSRVRPSPAIGSPGSSGARSIPLPAGWCSRSAAVQAGSPSFSSLPAPGSWPWICPRPWTRTSRTTAITLELLICQADVMSLPFAPAQFDVVVAVGMIQHTPDPEKTIAELCAQLTPNGLLALDHYAPGGQGNRARRRLRRVMLALPPRLSLAAIRALVAGLWPLHRALFGPRDGFAAPVGSTTCSPGSRRSSTTSAATPSCRRRCCARGRSSTLTTA